jgi:glutathionyl-hydroquinone reductase
MADVLLDAELSGGEFARQESHFRDWVGPDPRSGAAGEHPPQAGRYHLYLSLACPWCHRTAIVRELNPKRIIPVGPGYDWSEAHGRA